MGTGDPAGVAVTHAMTSGMGGIRTAGDLVARMQMSRRMRISDAKAFVAERLNVKVSDLNDPIKMREVREKFRMGNVQPQSGQPKGMEAKQNIARLLGIEMNSLRASERRMHG